MKVAVLADTHAPRRWKHCPPPVAPYLHAADLILHAGDGHLVSALIIPVDA